MALTLCRHLCAHCCPVLPGILFATADHLQHGLDELPSGYTASLCHSISRATLYLLPKIDCHSASKLSSWGVQEPVLTALPFTCVGIGMAAQVALHCSNCFETAQYSTCAMHLLQDSTHIQLPIKLPKRGKEGVRNSDNKLQLRYSPSSSRFGLCRLDNHSSDGSQRCSPV